MAKNLLRVGIISTEDYKNRTIAIAKGQYRLKPGEPKIWFESLQSIAQVLSHENQKLLQIIVDTQPDSLQALAESTGRKLSNVSRTLRTMARYGIVELTRNQRKVKPRVLATEFQVEFGLMSSG